jgi:hypothetical protein
MDDYAPVEDRLREFWTDHPYGRVITELLHHEGDDFIVLASVYFGNELRNDPPTATGLAHDAGSMLRKDMAASALEICETSAIGRALANAGYAAKGKRPSREEMLKTSAGDKGALPSRPAEPRPESADGDSQASRGAVPSSAPVSEPHEHVAGGKMLASGKVLCIFENSDGTTCGKPFKPRPVSVLTAPILEDEARADLA